MSSNCPIFAIADNNKPIISSVMPSVVNAKGINSEVGGSTTDGSICKVQDLMKIFSEEEIAMDVKVATVDAGREQIKESNNISDIANLTAPDVLLEMDACLLRSEKNMFDSTVIPEVNFMDERNDCSDSVEAASDNVMDFPIASDSGIAGKNDDIFQVANLDTISAEKTSATIMKEMKANNVDEKTVENTDATVVAMNFVESTSVAEVSDDVVMISDVKGEELTDTHIGTISADEITVVSIKEMKANNVDEKTVENTDATVVAMNFVESTAVAEVSDDVVMISDVKGEETTDVDIVKCNEILDSFPPIKDLGQDLSQIKESRIEITTSEVSDSETECYTSLEGSQCVRNENFNAETDDNDRAPSDTVTREIEPAECPVMHIDNLLNTSESDITAIVKEIDNVQNIKIEESISDVFEEVKIKGGGGQEEEKEEEDGVVMDKGARTKQKNESDSVGIKKEQDEVKERSLDNIKCNDDDDELKEVKDEETVRPVRIRKEFSTSSASVNIFASALARAAGVKRSDLHEQNSKKESLKIERNEKGERDKVERIEKERLIKVAKELAEAKEKIKQEKERILKQDKYERAEKEKQAQILAKREETLRNHKTQSPKILEYDDHAHSNDTSNNNVRNRNERDSQVRLSGNRIPPHNSRNVPHVDTFSRSTSQPTIRSDSHHRLQQPKHMTGIGSSGDKVVEKDSRERAGYSLQGSSPNYKNNFEDNQNNNLNGKISIGNRKSNKSLNHQESQLGALSGKFHTLMDDSPGYATKNIKMEKTVHANDYSTGKSYHYDIDINNNNCDGDDDENDRYRSDRNSINSGHINDYSTANNNNNNNNNNDYNNGKNNIYDSINKHINKSNVNDYNKNNNNINKNNVNKNNDYNDNNDNNISRSSNSYDKNKIYSNTGRDVSTDDYSSTHSPTQSNNIEKRSGTDSNSSISKINYGNFPSAVKDTKTNNRTNDSYSNFHKSNSNHGSVNDNSDRNNYRSTDRGSTNNAVASKTSTGHANDYSTGRNYIDTDGSSNNKDSTNHGSSSSVRTHGESARTHGHINDYSTAKNNDYSADNTNNYSSNNNNQSNNGSVRRIKNIDNENDYSSGITNTYDNYSERSSSNSTDKRTSVSSGYKNDYSTDIRTTANQQHTGSQHNLTTPTSRQPSNNSSSNSKYDYGGNKGSNYSSENAVKMKNDHAHQHGSNASSKYNMTPGNSFSSEKSDGTYNRSRFASTTSAMSVNKKAVNVTTSAPPNADTYAEFMSTIIAKKEKDNERDKIKKRSKNWADEDDSDDEN